MLEKIKKDPITVITIISFTLFTSWWIILQFMNLPQDSVKNQLFAAVYGIIALWGGLWGLNISRKWGGIHSVLGKSILLFSIGLLLQETGQIIYSSYIYFLHIPVPYPSIGDLFFYGTIPFYILAVIYLARASGVHISLKSFTSKLQAVIIPAIVLIFSYLIFLRGYEFNWSQPLKMSLDLGVPVGQAIYISLAILTFTLTRGMLGGVMRIRVLLILMALGAQYAADWTFLYQTSREIWYAGGINDYMYLFSYSLMAFSLLQLKSIYNKLSE